MRHVGVLHAFILVGAGFGVAGGFRGLVIRVGFRRHVRFGRGHVGFWRGHFRGVGGLRLNAPRKSAKCHRAHQFPQRHCHRFLLGRIEKVDHRAGTANVIDFGVADSFSFSSAAQD